MMRKAGLCAIVTVVSASVLHHPFFTVMRVTFERSGGFAGLMLTTSINSATLSASDATQLRQLIESANFFQLPAEFPLSAQTDRFQYEITVEMGNQHHTVSVGEENVPATLRPLIEWCMEKARGN